MMISFLLKNYKKKIIFFYNNRNLIKAMGTNGKKLAIKRNSKDNNIKKLNNLYLSLIKRSWYNIKECD